MIRIRAMPSGVPHRPQLSSALAAAAWESQRLKPFVLTPGLGGIAEAKPCYKSLFFKLHRYRVTRSLLFLPQTARRARHYPQFPW